MNVSIQIAVKNNKFILFSSIYVYRNNQSCENRTLWSIRIKQEASPLSFRLHKSLTMSTYILFQAIEMLLVISTLKFFWGILLQ